MSTSEESVEVTTESTSGREPGFMGWVKYLWVEGLARKFIITHGEKNVVDLPLLIVVIAALVAPWLVAIGIVAAVVLGASVSVERQSDNDENADAAESAEGDAGPA